MARRSSRLSARKSSTPQPQRVSSLAYDDSHNPPRTAPRLTSLDEADEMPGAFPRDSLPATSTPPNDTPTKLAQHIANAVSGGWRTPKDTTPIRPSHEEMHPKQHQASTAKPREEARWLGFSSMSAHTEPPKGAAKFVPAIGTPSKTPRTTKVDRPTEYEFTFRAQSLELSNEAQKMMEEKRAEAAKIKEQMKLNSVKEDDSEATFGRTLATPKGKVGRFSDVHLADFKKMDSIAKHAAAGRPTSQDSMKGVTTSLKRSNSKAGLPQGGKAEYDSKRSAQPEKNSGRKTHIPLASPVKRLQTHVDRPEPTSTKRTKRSAEDDVSTTRPTSSNSDDNAPATPKGLRLHMQNPHLSTLATPTASSLGRQNSVKSIKTTMIPSLTRSPSKSAMKVPRSQQKPSQVPLLARSPSKSALPAIKNTVTVQDEPVQPLLSRSPIKAPAHETLDTSDKPEASVSSAIPFLARSPTRMPVVEHTESEQETHKTPLLARSPSKAAGSANPFAPENTPSKASGTSFMDRFKLLKASPMKSILRSPQRLYSDDPAKIANGTHLATPEKEKPRNKSFLFPPKTEPVRKHVDFSASTKRDDGKDELDTLSKSTTPPAHKNITSVAQAKLFYPPLPSEHGDQPASTKKFNRRLTLGANTPGDFTFRMGCGITFGPSTSGPAPSPGSAEKSSRLKASIRHVSAEPEARSAGLVRKRKFENEVDDMHSNTHEQNKRVMDAGHGLRDKENNTVSSDDEDDNDRPAKRVKSSAPSPKSKMSMPSSKQNIRSSMSPVKNPIPVKRHPTLGVKPRDAPKNIAGRNLNRDKEKKGGFLSKARLDMLAMPKRKTGQ